LSPLERIPSIAAGGRSLREMHGSAGPPHYESRRQIRRLDWLFRRIEARCSCADGRGSICVQELFGGPGTLDGGAGV
jgi:hypothetical protein